MRNESRLEAGRVDEEEGGKTRQVEEGLRGEPKKEAREEREERDEDSHDGNP